MPQNYELRVIGILWDSKHFLVGLGPELRLQIQALSAGIEGSGLDLTSKFSPCINEIILILSSFQLKFSLKSCLKEEFSGCQTLWGTSVTGTVDSFLACTQLAQECASEASLEILRVSSCCDVLSFATSSLLS